MLNAASPTSYILSFDVEEHHRIEAAVNVPCSDELKRDYADRMERSTRAILERLASTNTLATFYIVGEIAKSHRNLVRDIANEGHEIGTHSYDHQRVHRFTPKTFRDDLRRSIDVIEDAAGVKVHGYRAPTFSVMRQTAWAVDVLADVGLRYDSSIFPVHHDRYGVPDAPRTPFVAVGRTHEILELPPATYSFSGQNLPVAGGGYFRLFPLMVMRAGLSQLSRKTTPAVGMLYFHPWEFDPTQPKLPLRKLSKWRTYVGIGKSMNRLDQLLRDYQFRRAIDVVNELDTMRGSLPRFSMN
jgi:polysaccharide deacetylase family protein (PEP-CTERM system associated)